jgi:hypothetical protein
MFGVTFAIIKTHCTQKKFDYFVAMLATVMSM